MPAPALAGTAAFGRKTPYSAAPPAPPSVVRTRIVAGAAELLAPVEARERAGIGHARGHELRAAPVVQVALVDALGPDAAADRAAQARVAEAVVGVEEQRLDRQQEDGRGQTRDEPGEQPVDEDPAPRPGAAVGALVRVVADEQPGRQRQDPDDPLDRDEQHEADHDRDGHPDPDIGGRDGARDRPGDSRRRLDPLVAGGAARATDTGQRRSARGTAHCRRAHPRSGAAGCTWRPARTATARRS